MPSHCDSSVLFHSSSPGGQWKYAVLGTEVSAASTKADYRGRAGIHRTPANGGKTAKLPLQTHGLFGVGGWKR